MTARRHGGVGPGWTDEEARVLRALRSPAEVQAFLDGAAYSTEPIYRAPRSVVRDRRAHCFDGAVFAAAALERLGYAPSIMELRAVRDDDHVIALYRVDGCLGAVAKSNFVGLRFREPVYRTPRELALSYFASYFNTAREKTLRAYSTIVRLDDRGLPMWRTDDAVMEEIARRLDRARHFALLTAAQARRLAPVDDRTFEGEMLGTDLAGLYEVRP